jgi:hypothetical protein
LNQPIGSTLLDAQAALHWLAAQPPDLDEVRQSLANTTAAAKRAGDITGRYRDLIKKHTSDGSTGHHLRNPRGRRTYAP